MTRENGKSFEHFGRNVGAAAGALFVAATIAEAIKTREVHRGRSDKASVLSVVRDGDLSTFFVPGYHADGEVIAKNLDKHLAHTGTTHYAVHPEKGFDIDSIKEQWIEARKKDGFRPTRIYAQSMGALLFAHLATDEEFMEQFGEIRDVNLDCGLSGRDDLGLYSKLAMAAGIILPSTYTTGKIYKLFNSQDLRDEIEHDPSVTDEEVMEHYLSSANTPFSAGKSQIWFMHTHDAADMDLSALGATIDGLRYRAPLKDKVVNNQRAAETYSRTYDRPLELWTDTRVKEGHALAPEWPQGAVDMLLNENRDNYRLSTIGNTGKAIYLPKNSLGESAA